MADGEERDARAAHPASEPVERDVADRHEPLLVALADDPHEGAVDREVLAVEADRLADPQARGVQELEQGPVAQGVTGAVPAGSSRRLVAAGGLQQALDLVDGQRLGQQPGRSRQVEVGRDVDADQALAVGEPVEALERGRAAPKAARGEAGVAAAAAPRPCRR